MAMQSEPWFESDLCLGSVRRRLLLLYNINDTEVTVIYTPFVFTLRELHSRFFTCHFTHVKLGLMVVVTTGEVTEVWKWSANN